MGIKLNNLSMSNFEWAQNKDLDVNFMIIKAHGPKDCSWGPPKSPPPLIKLKFHKMRLGELFRPYLKRSLSK